MDKDTSPPSLRQLVGAPVPVPVGNIMLPIAPMSWWTATDALDAIMPAVDTMPAPPDEGQDLSAVAKAQWLEWVNNNRQAVAEFCALASGQPVEDVKAIQPTTMVELAFAIIGVNADFFIASLPAVVARVRKRVGELKAQAAQALATSLSSTSSSTSSAEVTSSPS